jgi:Aminotransferase class-V
MGSSVRTCWLTAFSWCPGRSPTWKYAAGTPNILGAIDSAQAVRLLLDLALTPRRPAYFGTARPVERAAVQEAMDRVSRWNQELTRRAMDGLSEVPGITMYGPRDAARRTSLVAFNLVGRDPVSVAQALNRAGIESRAGCHCATVAHQTLGLTPPASCRLSSYLYNTPGEVDRAVAEVTAIAAGRCAPRRRFRPWPSRVLAGSRQAASGRGQQCLPSSDWPGRCGAPASSASTATATPPDSGSATAAVRRAGLGACPAARNWTGPGATSSPSEAGPRGVADFS